MKGIIACALLVTMMTLGPAYAQGDSQSTGPQKKTIAIVTDGMGAHYELFMNELIKEVTSFSEGKYDLTIVQSDDAAWDETVLRSRFNEYMQDPSIDLVVGLGFLSTQIAIESLPASKPIYAGALVDIDLQGLPYKDGVSGVKNFCYLARKGSAQSQLAMLQRVRPFEKVHVLVKQQYLARVKEVIKKTDEHRIEFIPFKETAVATVADLDARDIEILAIDSIPFTGDEKKALIAGINNLKIITFSTTGYLDVDEGVLMGSMPAVITKITRRIAINIDRILSGEDAGTLPVVLDYNERLVINHQTAQTIGFAIPFDVLMDAELIKRADATGDMLTINQAVDDALENNWNFRIADQVIKSTEKDHLLQWANYLPSVQGYLSFDVVDSETARTSSGTIPKRESRIGIGLNQLIFSDPAIKSIANAGKQVEISKLLKKTETLDITSYTVNAYLNYLRQKALFNVENQDLAAIAEHLNTAKKRQQSGVAGKEEVMRWEAENAEQKADTLRSGANVRQARVTLNQLMNKTLEKDFVEQDVGLEMVNYYIGSTYLAEYIRDANVLEAMLQLLSSKAKHNAPEVRALNIAIAQERNKIRSAAGRYVLPEARMTGNLSNAIDDEYYSTPIQDDHDDWEIGFEITYPFFDRGRRGLNYLKYRDELRRIQFKRALKEQEIERDLRNAGYDLFYSYMSIDLAHQAMVSSTGNYKIISNKYAQGTASITDLLNARNDKFRREGNAVVSVYNFLNNLSLFDRQLAHFYMLSTEEERAAWLENISDYLKSKSLI